MSENSAGFMAWNIPRIQSPLPTFTATTLIWATIISCQTHYKQLLPVSLLLPRSPVLNVATKVILQIRPSNSSAQKLLMSSHLILNESQNPYSGAQAPKRTWLLSPPDLTSRHSLLWSNCLPANPVASQAYVQFSSPTFAVLSLESTPQVSALLPSSSPFRHSKVTF